MNKRSGAASKTRVVFSFAVVMLLATATGVFGVKGIVELKARQDSIYSDSRDAAYSILLLEHFARLQVDLQNTILEKDPTRFQEYKQSFDSAKTNLLTILESPTAGFSKHAPDLAQRYNQAKSSLEYWLRVAEPTISSAESGRRDESWRILNSNPMFEAGNKFADSIRFIYRRLAPSSKLEEEAEEMVKKSIHILWILTASSAICCIGMGAMILLSNSTTSARHGSRQGIRLCKQCKGNIDN